MRICEKSRWHDSARGARARVYARDVHKHIAAFKPLLSSRSLPLQ
jgi:hypothetical protein